MSSTSGTNAGGAETGGSEAGRLFRAGQLGEAVQAANAALRKAPTDVGARILLAELLVFSGNFERADVVLDACGDIDPGIAVVVAEFRQILRAEVARRQVFRDGRSPEFLLDVTSSQRDSLAALTALRLGDAAEAARLSEAAEAARPHPSGRAGDAPFDDLRDADDLLASSIEVITTTGRYFWVPVEKVMSIEFHAPKRPRDLYWRRASMQVSGGPDGDVYIPALYPTQAEAELSDALRLGRATDWVPSGEDGPVRGVGAVTWLVGEEAPALMELSMLSFDLAG